MISPQDQGPKDRALTAKARRQKQPEIAVVRRDGDPPIESVEQLEAAMEEVTFERSCLDMGWEWEVRSVRVGLGTGGGWMMRCSFRRPDRSTGKIGRGFGRWWIIETFTTKSAVQKTMYAATKMIVEHELMEAFKVLGRRPFDPHRTIGELVGGLQPIDRSTL